MMSGAPEKGRSLPKFGEWDENNPASADGFTVIFAKARDEKKSNGTVATAAAPATYNHRPYNDDRPHPRKKCRLCCF